MSSSSSSEQPRLLPKVLSFLSSVSGSDKVFRTLVYTLRIASVTLNNKYGEGKSPLAKRISNFTSPITDTRMVLRLFGVLPTIEGVLTNDETDPFLRPLTIVQAWSMVLYYPLDNVYWLALHEVIPMSEETRDAASRVSCQAWGLYIVLDIAAYVYNMRKLVDEQKLLKATLKHIKAQASSGHASTGDSSKTIADIKAKIASIDNQLGDMRLRTIACLADLALAVHWSVKKSSFPPLGVGIVGSISSVIGLYLKWKYT